MDEINIENLRTLCRKGKISWTLHALKRIRERNIRPDEVVECIIHGKIIEHYQDDKPFPSCLICSLKDGSCIHTVVSSDGVKIYFITAYYPSKDEWEMDYETRKVHN